MRLGQSQAVRSDWYDRSILPVVIAGATSVAPHASLIRETYTVPASRKAFLSAARLILYRSTSPSAPGTASISITYNALAIQVSDITFSELRDSALSLVHEASLSNSILLVASDVIRVVTRDLGIGGSVLYRWGISFVEFDA